MSKTTYPKQFEFVTVDGFGEATKADADAAWEANFPSGSLKFYGTKSQLLAELREREGWVRVIEATKNDGPCHAKAREEAGL